MLLVSVDPGIRGSGVAILGEDGLFTAAYVFNPVRRGNTPEAISSMAHALCTHICASLYARPPQASDQYHGVSLVVEWPQIYTHGKGKGDPNDLLPLVGVDMALMGMLNTPTFRYLPREWKGTIDPEEMTRRVRRRLTPGEFARIAFPRNTCAPCYVHLAQEDCAKSTCLAHNVYDAIGIGLKHLGRLEARKVITR